MFKFQAYPELPRESAQALYVLEPLKRKVMTVIVVRVYEVNVPLRPLREAPVHHPLLS
jgi:hypothetical protein